jgi:predicted  nucleic acid-binding Zn-ribbon protein
MGVRQLYHLQCIDLEIDAAERASARAEAKLNENEELRQAKARLDKAQAELNALLKKQKDNDNVITDITAKITVTNESLYSGRVSNPKELASLQHELDSLIKQRSPLEDNALALMEKIEKVQTQLNELGDELKTIESRLCEEHKVLHKQIDELKIKLAELHEKRSQALAAIPNEEVSFYSDIKTRRGTAVARVDRWTCGSCRIVLSSAELQRARGGRIVQCSSCSRILFFE